MQTRQPTIAIVSGTTGTGKSFFCKGMAKAIKGRKLVVSYTGRQKSWQEIKFINPTNTNPQPFKFKRGWRQLRYKSTELKNPLEHIYDHYKNGSLILDDMRNYVGSNWEHTKGLTETIIDHRHNGLDIFLITHSLKQLPPSLWAFVKWAFIFKCPELPQYKNLIIDKAEAVIQAQKKANYRFDAAFNKGVKTYGIYETVKL